MRLPKSLVIALALSLPTPGTHVFAAPPIRSEGAAGGDAKETEKVRQWVRIATEEYAKEHWAAARDAYLKAWAIRQHYVIASSLAEVEMRLGIYREAAEHWKFHLANLPPERADRRAEAEKHLLECKERLSVTRVSVSVEGATVRLDDREIGESPLGEELWLEPGRHVLEASKAGYRTTARAFEATAGETREIALDVRLPISPPAPVPEPAKLPSGSEQKSGSGAFGLPPRTLVLIGGGVLTLTAVGIAVGYALKGKSADDAAGDIREALGAEPWLCRLDSVQQPPSCRLLDETLEDRNAANKVANVALGGATVLGAATLAAFLFWPAANSEARVPPKATVSPWSVAGGHGVQVLGTF